MDTATCPCEKFHVVFAVMVPPRMECTPISSCCGDSRRGGRLQLAGFVELSLSAFASIARCRSESPASCVVALRDFNVETLAQHGGSLFDQLYLQAYAQTTCCAVEYGDCGDALRRRESSSSLRPVVPSPDARRSFCSIQYGGNCAGVRKSNTTSAPEGASDMYRNQMYRKSWRSWFCSPPRAAGNPWVFEQKLFDGGAIWTQAR